MIGALVVCGCGGGLSGDQAAVQHVIKTLRADVVQQRYIAACALLDPKLAASISSETLGPPKTCATGLAAADRRSPSALRDLPTGPITMRGDCGYVPRPCHGTDCGAIAPITVCRGQRGWRVATL